jgi:hypothetical protein
MSAKRFLYICAALLFLLTSTPAARAYPRSTHRTTHYKAAPGVARDSHGRIKRSESAKREFERETGNPHGRPGYVVDHVVPLARGGADDPGNMQWQTIEEAKAKDKVELGQHPRSKSHTHRKD